MDRELGEEDCIRCAGSGYADFMAYEECKACGGNGVRDEDKFLYVTVSNDKIGYDITMPTDELKEWIENENDAEFIPDKVPKYVIIPTWLTKREFETMPIAEI